MYGSEPRVLSPFRTASEAGTEKKADSPDDRRVRQSGQGEGSWPSNRFLHAFLFEAILIQGRHVQSEVAARLQAQLHQKLAGGPMVGQNLGIEDPRRADRDADAPPKIETL